MNTSTLSPFRSAGTSRPGLLVLLLAGIVTALTPAAFAQVQAPTLSLSLAPEDIGPGSCTELTFTINNPLSVVATNVAFSLDLPAGVILATPANPVSNCDGTVTAPNGGSMIALNAGRVSANSTCTLRVGLTGSTNGTFTLTTSPLTTSAGSSGAASIDLTVHEFSRPGFTKAFSPNPIGFSGRSTLTYTLENNNEVTLSNLTFSDTLPPGVVIAGPANVSTSCQNADVTAVPGSSTISLAPAGFGAPMLGPGNCTISVDVIGTGVGANNSISSDLTFTSGPQGQAASAGRACAILNVLSPGTLQLTKSFLDDPVAPGGTTTLQFTLTNLDRSETATNISFTDDLDATLSGLTALDLPANDLCGIGSSLSGNSMLNFSGGTLAAGESCTFSVQLNLPSTVDTGSYPNTTSTVTGDAGGRQVTGGAASDSLFVAPIPTFTKSFTDDPVGAGDTVTLEYTITNTSTTSELTGLAFTEVLDDTVPDITISGALPTDPCGAGSTLIFIPAGQFDPAELRLSGGNLPAGASCTFSVVLQLPTGISGASYPSTSGPLTGTIEDSPVTAPGATDDLVVVPPVSLLKEFIDDPVLPGETVTLEFTLSNTGEGAADATNISFTDDLEDTLEDLTAIGLPLTNICGAGSSLTASANDTLLTFSGGTLLAGETCTFSVTLQLHPNTDQFTYTNTTSEVTATVSGVATTGNAASANLIVGGLSISKEFIDDPALPGQTAILAFTITNEAAADATNITFTDNLDDALAGLVATGPPPLAPCGPGSSITYNSGNRIIVFTGGSVAAGASCSFMVNVAVPANAPNGAYRNITTDGSATIGGSTITLAPAADDLVVDDAILSLRKEFIDDPVAPGDTATLEFTLTNLSASQTINQIAFTDDLSAALSGLVAVGLPANDVCGPGSRISGTDLLTFTGGSLAPGANCTFSVTVQVPAAAPQGTAVTNTTSVVTGNVGAAAPLSVSGTPASDDLLIESLRLTKSFSGSASPGGTVTLTFTLENLGGTSVSDLSFTDNLDAVLPGLTATGLPLADVCGTGSQLAGTSVITLSGASLGGGETCSFDVTIQIPANADGGNYPNTTSDLRQAGSPVASPASATLEVAPTVVTVSLSKSESIDPVVAGSGPGNLTYVITASNGGPSLATGVTVSEVLTLPAGVTVDSITPSAGTFTDPIWNIGTLAAGASETLTVVLTVDASAAEGTDVISDTATLESVNEPNLVDGEVTVTESTSIANEVDITLSISESIDPVVAGSGAGNLTYIVTARNLGPSDATGVTVVNGLSLPPFVTLDSITPSAGTSLAGNNWTIGDLAAGASATLTAVLTVGELAPEGGGTISDTASVNAVDQTDINVANNTITESTSVANEVDLAITKADSIDPVIAGSGPGNLVHTVTVTNAGPSAARNAIIQEAITLPAGVTIDSIVPSIGSYAPANAPNGNWTLTLPPGDTATLTVTFTVAPDAPNNGTIVNTASFGGLDGTDTNPANDSATEETTILAGVDLVVTKTESSDPVIAGSGTGNLTYVITVTNNGPLDATGVEVTEQLSFGAGIGVESFTPSAGILNGVVWEVGNLANGASETLTVILTVGPSAPEGIDTITNTASVSAVDQPQINTGDESATVSTSIIREVDLVLTVEESRDPVLAGFNLPSNLIHTVIVTNLGPSDASGVVLDLALVLPPGATLDTLTPDRGTADIEEWDVGDLARGESLNLAVSLSVPATTPGGIDTISTSAEVDDWNETLLNPDDDQAAVATSVVSPASISLAAGEIVLDLQSALFKQTITITNNNPLAVPGFRVLVNGLPADVSVFNAQGEAGGTSFLLSNQALAANGSVDLVVEYFQEGAAGGFTPTFTIELLDPAAVQPSPEGAGLERIVALANGDILIEFSSTPGTSYTIQYSHDGIDWFDVIPSVTAGATRTQWIDNGPPKTPTHPSVTPTRLYRVVTDGN